MLVITIASRPVSATPRPSSTPSATPSVIVVGIGADGWAGLADQVKEVVLGAGTVIGGSRHLDLLPDVPDQERRSWPSPLRPGLHDLLGSLTRGPVVALASGDPLVSGIGSTLVELLGADRVVLLPAVSSIALARAELGWPAESCAVVRVDGREVAAVARELAPGRRVLVLSADETTPDAVAALLVVAGYGASRMTVLGNLGSADATRLEGTAESWSAASPRLHVLALELDGPHVGGWTAGLPDSAFEHDGQLTKRDLRAAALARLAPTPGAHLWDVGAGAGSIGIEWLRAHPTCTATAVEADPERADRIVRNAHALGVPGLEVVPGRAPAALVGLSTPDAIFVGGGATRDGVLDRCLAALGPGGRLVVHGVTVETEQLLATRYQQHGGELTRISVETAAAIGGFTGWTPARTVTQWAYAVPPTAPARSRDAE